ETQGEGVAAIVTFPDRPATRALSSLMVASSSAAMRFAPHENTSPSGVNATYRVLRSNKRAPTVSSSRLMIWLKAEVEIWHRSAATEKRRVSSNARKASIWVVEILI